LPFVMVPVPEEHVVEVMAFVARLSAKAAPREWPPKQWDQPALDELIAEANERTRALLSFLAQRGRAGKEVAPREIAAALRLDRREVPGILGPLNRLCRRANRAPLFESRVRTVTTADGRPEKRRSVMMTKETARMVRAAEQALRSRASIPEPVT
jgi:chorismate mutase